MMLAVVDPRSVGPLERARGSESALPSRDDLIASFIDVDRRETSALLAGWNREFRRESSWRPGVDPGVDI
jgi:hypothetical protein